MRLVFIRHGEPDYAHDCLTPLGLLQAEACAKRLMDEGIEEIYTSPMGRARQTADAAARVLHLEPKVLDFMHEVTWGSTDGQPLYADGHPWAIADEIARQGFDLTRKDWTEHPYFKTNSVLQCVEEVTRGIDGWMASLGYVREGDYYRCVREDDAQHTVALFSHGGSSAAAMGRILNQTFPYMGGLLHLPFTGITIIRMDRKPGSLHLPVLELAGDGRHIRDVKLEA